DVTAYLGKGLSVVFLPAGERDPSLRQIHVEKLSEFADGDLRPYNLTDTKDAQRTYYTDILHPTADYAVTPGRELWVLGSIDNYKINLNGADAEMADADSYQIKIKPCDGLTGADLTACQAPGVHHQVLVQTTIRSFDKELAPLLIAA